MSSERPTWAPRLPRREIARLYETDARGIVNEDLVNEVGYGLFARCRSVLAVEEAYGERKVQCPSCRAQIRSDPRKDKIISCTACDWSLPWTEFRRTTRRKCLDIGGTPELSQTFKQWQANLKRSQGL